MDIECSFSFINVLFEVTKACSSGYGSYLRVLFNYYGNYLFQNILHCTPSRKPNSSPSQLAQNSQIESVARKRKSAISMFYVYLVFLVCHLPQYCVRVAYLIQSPPSTALRVTDLFSTTLVFLNSSLNPVIYGWKMRHIRHAMIDVLRNIFPRQNQANLYLLDSYVVKMPLETLLANYN